MDVRSLRSDRAWLELGCYLATEQNGRSVATISEDARILAKRQILGSRIKVFDTMPRDVKDQCVGFRASPRFSAYTTCMVGTEHLSKDNF
ncbi:hypothetical protein F2Q68_00011243 [Brassica cretica]|uniref:Uncharacterized protein n=1 Tax=Brassica cretica TaxID=69181 RepID=A0A8S9KSL5_BRACR|nr:hypothetical protein F2Q68_00011243 [Brassica cretica]